MHRRPSRLTALWVVAAALFSGCNKEDPIAPRIVSLEVVSGMNQSGFVGGLLNSPLVVRARDQDGQTVSGIQIGWTVTGGGVATPSSSVSDVDGLASTSYRLGATVGTQTVTATINGGSQGVTFSATATPAPASMITITAGDDQTAVVRTQLPTDLTVKISDAFGNAKEGTTVFFTVVLGGGTLSSPTAVSDASGLARVKWTLGPPASTQRVAAQIPGTLPAIFDAIATPAAPAIVVIVSGNDQVAQPGSLLPDSLVIRVTDLYENPVKDVNVTWAAVGSGGGTVSPAAGKTNQVGRLATAWTLGSGGGPKELRASASGVATGSFRAAGTIVFKTVMVGDRHTCGLGEDGAAFCWGSNDAGQLGIGITGTPPLFSNLSPIVVAGGLSFLRGTSGEAHTCAVTLVAVAYCWGSNDAGQLGSGGSGVNPSQVGGSNAFNLLSAGVKHTCGLTTGGRVFCWGSNAEGQIGVGPATGPFQSPQPVAPSLTFSSIAAGELHSCGATTTREGYCWGSNVQGQAGLGTAPGSNMPSGIPGSGFVEVAAGRNHSCGRLDTNEVYCWGKNEFGQLGEASTIDQTVPTPIGATLASITAGRNHTCGLTAGGVAYCWGDNSSGQLGTGTDLDQSSVPVPVGGGLTFLVLSAGGDQTCGVTVGRVAYCWGDNTYGALGDGTQFNSDLPVKVAFQP
jgi:alpha-tubulin suppressor-like RCC1 family protein